MDLQKKTRKLARDSCASYVDGGCVFEPLGRISCVYERNYDKLAYRCGYFETSVLPSDKLLESRYHDEVVNGDSNNEVIRCESCGKGYERTSNRQKYCVACRSEVQRDQRRKRDADYRDRKRRSKATG